MLSQKQAAAQKPAQPPAADKPKTPVKQPERDRSAEKSAESKPAAKPASSQNTQNAERASAKNERAPKNEAPKSDRTSQTAEANEAKDKQTTDKAEAADPSLAEFLAGLNLPANTAQDTPTGLGLPGRGGHAGEGGDEAGAHGDTGLLDDANGARTGAGRRGPADLRGDDRLGAAARGHDERGGVQVAADAHAEQNASMAWQAVAEEAHLAVPEAASRHDVSASGPLGAAGLASPTAARHEAAAVVSVPTPAQSPEFPQALGVQLSLLAKDGVQQAELHLNPADMGPISVQIAIDGTQAQVNFGVDSAATRQIIENGLPELAAAMRDAGLTLSGGGVHQQAQQRGDGQGGDRSRGDGMSGQAGEVEADAVAPARLHARVSAGGVDLYA